MAYRCANTDRISHLPSEIIEKILNLLPCRDAAKTSILSSDWRYKWISMSDLNFREASGTSDQYAKFITKCLLRQQGPIRRFSVTARTLMVGHKIKQWMQLVSKHDIEELQVVLADLDYPRFPSSLFNCKKLTHLELYDCLLDVPLTFEGFMNLKVLNLSSIEVKDKSSIESLISKSPLLESLSLYILDCSNITISAPKIKYLSLQGDLIDICLKKSPVLVDISLHLDNYDLIKIFGDAPNLFNCNKLTHLDLSGDMLTIPPTFEGFMNLKALKLSFTKVDSSIESLICKSPLLESLSLHISYRKHGSNITISAPKIKHLSLQGNFKDICLKKSPVLVDMSLYSWGYPRDQCDLIKILGGAPNLEKLVIYNRYSHSLPNEADPDFWQKEYLAGHCFMKLKVVELGDILCKPPEIELAKFILSKSPILEKMTIGTRERNQAVLNHMLKKWRTLPRASPRAAVIFHDRDSWRPNCSSEI